MLPRQPHALALDGQVAAGRPRLLTQAGFEIYSSRLRFTRTRIWTFAFLSVMTFLVAGYTYVFFLLELEGLRLMLVIPGLAIFHMFTSEFSRGRTFRLTEPQGRLLVGFVVIVMFSGAFAINRGASLEEFEYFIKMVLLYILVTNAIRHPRQLHLTLLVIAVSSTVPALGAIQSYFTGGPLREGFRAAWIGNFWDSNRLAGVLAMGVPTHLYAMREARIPGARVLFGGTLAVSLIAILLSGSRGGMLALVAVCATGLLLANRRAMVVLMIAATVIVMVVAAPAEIRGRWTSDTLTTGTGRTLIWGNGLRILMQRPITGVGIGNFFWATGNVYTEQAPAMTRYRGAHNTWLQVGAETGLPGLACFAGLFFTALLDMHRLLREGQRRKEVVGARGSETGGSDKDRDDTMAWTCRAASTIIACLVGMGVGALTVDYGYEWYVYMFIALAVVLKQIYRDWLVEEPAGSTCGEESGAEAEASEEPSRKGQGAIMLGPAERGVRTEGSGIAQERGAPSWRQRRMDMQARRLAARMMAQQDAEMGRGPGGHGGKGRIRGFSGLRFRGSV